MERAMRYGGSVSSYLHVRCWGRIVNLYVFKDRKWLKIGEYCQGCGGNIILPEFEKGIKKKS